MVLSKRLLSLLVCAVAAAVPFASVSAQQAKKLTIAVIPKGTTHEFWKSIHAGAIKSQQELEAAGQPVELIWKGPLKEDDREGQIQVVENFTSMKVSGMVLAPLDATALAEPAEGAIGQKIPVVVIDSALNSKKVAAFVATNNFEGGKLGAKRLGEVLGGKGKAILLRYQEGSASTEEREKGFLEGIKAVPGIEVISSNQHSGATRDTAYQASQNLLNRYGQEVNGIFTPNESSTAGMILALKEAGLAGGKVKHVGFDSSAPLVTALKAGDVQGLVVQDPVTMGYLGVKTLVSAIKGEKVEPKVDTPVNVITPDNISDPKIVELINPPLSKYLKE
jgi:ribose transport system substrate-binding protein